MKKPISATIEEDLIRWISKKVSKDKTKYRNKSHLIETALEKMRAEEKEE
jgi:Arc/MetJ-type ribon-helix-helix transcriptional regulator